MHLGTLAAALEVAALPELSWGILLTPLFLGIFRGGKVMYTNPISSYP